MKISVVMPSFNQARYIRAALDSIVRQKGDATFKIQLIVQDNISNDGSASIIEKYSRYNFVEIFFEQDAGQADALSRGFARADGDILCWLNSDDLLLPGTFKKVIDVFANNPTIDVLYGDALFIDEDGVVVGGYPTTDFDKKLLLSTCYLSQPSVFFRKNVYEDVGGVKQHFQYCMDYDLWVRFSLINANIVYISELFSATRLHSDTKTFLGGDKFVDEILTMLSQNLGTIPPAWILYKKYSTLRKTVKPKYLAFLLALLCFCFTNCKDMLSVFSVVKHYIMVRVKNYWLYRTTVGNGIIN